MALVELLEAFGQPLITSFITKLALVIKNRLRKCVPDFVAHRLTRKLARSFFEVAPESIITFVAPSESYDDYARRQFPVSRQVIQRWDKFAICEITRSTEDHDAAGLWNGPRGQSFPQRVCLGLIRRAIHCRRKLFGFIRSDSGNSKQRNYPAVSERNRSMSTLSWSRCGLLLRPERVAIPNQPELSKCAP